jgi:hypothetical protein
LNFQKPKSGNCIPQGSVCPLASTQKTKTDLNNTTSAPPVSMTSRNVIKQVFAQFKKTKMKKVILMTVVAIIVSMKGYAQDSTRTLFHLSMPKYFGLYLAPEFQYGQLKGQFTSFGGGSAMLLFNKKFAIGLTMQQNLYRSFSPAGISPLVLHGGFGGLKLEYTCNPDAVVHLSFPLVIGMGMATVDSANYTAWRNNDTTSYRQNHQFEDRRGRNRNEYFMLQPGVQVEANLFKYLKLFAGANYRFAFATYNTNNSPLISQSTLQGLSMNVGLKFGLFDFSPGRGKK